MTKVLIDCDPGIDDALALALAAGTSLPLAGITTVGGNVGLGLTTANALALREFLDLGDVPVVAGCSGAIIRGPIDAAEVHGTSGIGDVVLPPATRPVHEGHAVDFIIETLKASPGEITLVATGPLTNIALAVRREPRVAEWVRDFVIMGGSYTRGNTNPAAEFNILTDPEAAAIVFGAGWTVTMVGLDVTLQALVTAPILDEMRGLGRLSELLVPACQYYGVVTADGGPALHDAVALAHVLDPSLLTLTPAAVDVETAGVHTAGMTVVDFRLRGRSPNALVATGVDVAGFWKLMLGAYRRLGERLG
ncbi:nucleoside hydrolase [Nonomuraea sp. NBC_01738]|uniref:nucleoside hydrolase n=1 Tax=Nonomuraea sp. NBC_01738 TaxID=2976003 RepID=UPI002E122281|nr:nucleoside hydrolase [Nonomuraea sp. NBC_01738]